MLTTTMQSLIVKALPTITSISTYVGYNDADIVQLEFKDYELLRTIRSYCRDTGATTKTEGLTLYCIFELPTDIYQLKR